MASVWLAFDQVLARPVAVKILRDDLAGDLTFARRFHTEAVAAGRLTHPNIVQVFDTGVESGVHYIVMEHFRGRTLRQVMAAEPQMEPDRAVELVCPVLAGLAFAHAQGVLHRDVTPGNILVGDDGRVKVTDFGIAKAAFAEANLTRTGSVLGTVRYVSPEQVAGGEIDGRSDVYSVGVVLYEMLTGRPPFVAETDVATAMMRLQADPVPPRAIRPAIPRPLEAVVQRATARNRDERFPSAQSMGAALDRLRAAEATPPYGMAPVSATAARTRPRGRRAVPWLAILTLVALLGAAVAAIALVTNGFGAGSPGATPPRKTAPAGGTGRPATLRIAAARDFDPEGDDRSENPETARLAVDGSPSTAWVTDQYASAAFGNLKSGVGLWLDLGSIRKIASVTVRSPNSGWTFELRPGPYGNPGEPLRATDGSTSFTIHGGSVTVGLPSPAASGILIWITSLGPDDGRFAAAISDVTVRGA